MRQRFIAMYYSVAMTLRTLILLAATAMAVLLAGCGSSHGGSQREVGSSQQTSKPTNHNDPWSACAADRTSQQPFVWDYADDIWTMDIDGSNRQQLTATGEVEGSTVVEGQPAWSPNHEWIAFVRSHYISTSESAEPEGQSFLYVMNADGSCQTKLVANALEPTWSPDGTKIAFTADRSAEGTTSIYVMNADGSGKPRRITNGGRDQSPAWSPDGEKTAFERSNEIYVTEACCELSPPERLVAGPGGDSQPVWSPDGTELAFIHSSFRRAEDPFESDLISTDVYKIDADGSRETRLTDTYSTKHREYSPVWSPEGDQLAFIEGNISGRDSEYSSTIYLMESDGSQPTIVARVPEIAYSIVLDWG